MNKNFDWNDIPILLALARTGSANAASRMLGMDPSTVSRRLRAAERALNARLFLRSHTGMCVTELGQAFIERASGIADHVDSMLVDCAQQADAVTGTVRLSAIDFLFDYWLIHYFAEFAHSYPQLGVHLIASNQNLSFARREIDFALRLTRPIDDGGFVMRKLGDVGWTVFAAPSYAAVARKDWEQQPWLSYGEDLVHLPEMRWLTENVPQATRKLCMDSLTTMVVACRAGAGMALLPCIVGSQVDLVCMSEQIELRRELWLLAHRDTATTRRTRLVSDWLLDRYHHSREALMGMQRGPT